MALDLGKQVGPLPLGAWLAVVGIGGGIAWYTRKQNASTPVPMEDVSITPGVGVGGAGFTQVGVPPAATSPAKPTTNEEWGHQMVSWLIGMGYPPVQSNDAVTKYLNGAPLGPQEFALVSAGLLAIGPPPQQLGYVPNNPADTATVLYYLEGSKPAVWALANGPQGGWVETNSQLQANVWAGLYSDNKIATHVNAATWAQQKARWGGGS